MSEAYLLVYGNMNKLGGIESIIVRLSRFVQQQGGKVIVASYRGDLLHLLDPSTELLLLDDHENAKSMVRHLRGILPTRVKIIAFDPSSAALAYSISRRLARNKDLEVKLSVGVFHPRAFFMEQEKRHVHWMNFVLAFMVGLHRLFFMNAACKDSHERFFLRDLGESKIIPVPIDLRPACWSIQRDRKLRICSVGRIVPFKAYNFAAPTLAKKLLDCGVEISWDIFGHGSHEERLREEIRRHPSNNRVRFCGTLPLQDFDETVVNYDLFIGMGTAALQAAQLGVPTICAIDQDADMSYGYIYNIPFGNVGEKQEGIPLVPLLDAISNHSNTDDAARRYISERCSSVVSKYDMNNFLGGIDSSEIVAQSTTGNIRDVYCDVYSWTLRDSLVRRVYRSMRRVFGHSVPRSSGAQ